MFQGPLTTSTNRGNTFPGFPIATTDPQEHVPVGTVFIAVADNRSVKVHHIVLSGEPEEIRAGATELALLHLRRRAGLDVRMAAV